MILKFMNDKQSVIYLAVFDYDGKTVLASSASYESVSITSFTIVIGAPFVHKQQPWLGLFY